MALHVLANTKTMTEAEWLQLRNKGIGGSDAASAVGLNKFKSMVTLWLEKTGQIKPEDLSNNEAVYWGKTLEDVVAAEFSKRTKLKVRRCNSVLIHPQYQFMLANVDRAIIGKNQGLECKNVGARSAYLWGEDEVPDMYYVQCQHYCAVTGWEGMHIAVLIAGQQFVTKYISRNDEFINSLIEKENLFWQHVLNKTMPPPDCTPECNERLREMHPDSNGQEISLPDTAELYALEYIKASKDVKEATERKQQAQNTLQQMLGDNETGLVSNYKISWKTCNALESFDKEKFMSEHPGLYKNYVKRGKTYRRFNIR